MQPARHFVFETTALEHKTKLAKQFLIFEFLPELLSLLGFGYLTRSRRHLSPYVSPHCCCYCQFLIH